MKQWFAIFSLMSVLVSCKPDQEIDRGDEVYLQFELRNGRGIRIDDSKQPQGMLPLRIIAGNGYLPDKVDQLILEMKKDEIRTFRFAACDAYGRKGIYYCDTLNTKTYLIGPSDTLRLDIKVLPLQKNNNTIMKINLALIFLRLHNLALKKHEIAF